MFYILVRWQFGIGLDAMIRGRSGDKVERVVELISDELRDAGRDGWEAELERFGAAYGMSFSLYRSSGEWSRGPATSIPDAVKAEIGKHSLPAPGGRPGGPGLRDGPRDGPSGVRGTKPLFLIKSRSPKTYWLGARVQIGDRQENRRRQPPPRGPERRPPEGGPRGDHPPDILLASTRRLAGNDLLPDLRPWYAAGFGAVGLSVLFWTPFVRRITRSLREMRDTTREVAAGHFSTRAPEDRNDEIGQLGHSINRMSAKLEGYVNGQRRFLGDVAHELCSPIARMQMGLGVLEQRATSDMKSRVEDVRDELDQMSEIVDELLSFSKASLRPEAIKLEAVALGPLINDIAKRETGKLGAQFGIEESSGLRVLADKSLLGRALGNLVRNAVRYAGEGGPIGIDAEPIGGGKIEIRVSDSGPGVPDKALEHIFEPFYRPDAARTPGSGGAGLGLAIVKTCIDACGGTVRAENTHPGFEVTLTLEASN